MLIVNKPNRLIEETSPYLRQHAQNPVDWYPWGDEAFEKSRAQNKPILLSVGYSSCHWCHVMERESFEDEETAELMNEYFISIKVDREERPDVDQIYQEAVHVLGVQGGWPLTVFLTPDGKPFYGGTYFPPEPSYGRPSFRQVLTSVAGAWEDKREDILKQSQEIGKILTAEAKTERRPDSIAEITPEEIIYRAIQDMVSYTDRQNGGFGRSPKFPTVGNLMLLITHGHLHHMEEPVDLALLTLRKMTQGGIHDQLGGGFHRYSTDANWLVPHFEKMLYDNAQLMEAYVTAWQITRDQEFLESAQGIVDYLRREMLAPEGVFYATQDADSEGVEGKFYVWSYDELKGLLPDERVFEAFASFYGVTRSGNFEGKSILHEANPLESVAQSMNIPADEARSLIDSAEDILFAHRENRVKPFRDEKVILSWNGLTISGLCRLSQAAGDPETLHLAQTAANFILQSMRADETHLFRIYKDGQAKIPAFLDDYAFFTASLIDLYETDFNPHWLGTALTFVDTVLREHKKESGQYTLNSLKNGNLFEQPVSGTDQAIPSGVGIHCQNLIRIYALTGSDCYRHEAEEILGAYIHDISAQPFSYASLVTALDMFWSKPTEVVMVNAKNDRQGIVSKLQQSFVPYRTIALINEEKPSDRHPAAHLFEDRKAVNGEATFYVCSNFACHPPVTNWEELQGLLGLD